MSEEQNSARVILSPINIPIESEEDRIAVHTINNRVLPKLAQNLVQVVVIHKPTNESTSMSVPLVDVRRYAAQAIRSFPRPFGIEVDDREFVIVEVHAGTLKTRVSSLERL